MDFLYNFMNSKPARILRRTTRNIATIPAQRRIRATVASVASSIVTSVWSMAGTAPAGTPAVFLQAVQEYQVAEKQEKSGQTAGAVCHYQSAAKLLEQLSKSDPDWQHDIVEYRLRKTRENLTRLGKPAESAPQVAGAPAGNATATASAPSNVGRTLPLKGTAIFKGKNGDIFLEAGQMVTVVNENVEDQTVTITAPGALEEIQKNNWIVGLEDTTRMVRVCHYLNAKLIPGQKMNGGFLVPRMHIMPSGDEPDVPSTNVADEDKLIQLINEYRKSLGIAPLIKQASLTRSARIHCARMLQYGYCAPRGNAHSLGGPKMSAIERIRLYAPNGSGSAGESGIKMTAEMVLKSFLTRNTVECGETLATPRATAGEVEIKRPDNKYIGIGKVGDTWCLDFGT